VNDIHSFQKKHENSLKTHHVMDFTRPEIRFSPLYGTFDPGRFLHAGIPLYMLPNPGSPSQFKNVKIPITPVVYSEMYAGLMIHCSAHINAAARAEKTVPISPRNRCKPFQYSAPLK
jgi:hypothetical protein